MCRSDLLTQVHDHVVMLLGEEDPVFVDDLVGTFASSSVAALAEVEAAVAHGDPAALAAAAHALKGSASNIGLSDLASDWDAVEIAAHGGTARTEAVSNATAATRAAIARLADAG